MGKRVFVLCLVSFFSVNTFALAPPGNDVTTKPDLYYLTNTQATGSLALLSPLLMVGSIAFLNDQAMHEQRRLLRNTERGKLAAEGVNPSVGGVANAFSSIFGSPVTEKNTPQLHKLLTNMIGDAGDLAARDAKEKYIHIRPFAFYDVPTCNTTEQDKLSKGGFYLFGHTSIGQAVALVLAEINPQRQDETLKRGCEFGESRAICGYHWQSDVDVARIIGSVVVTALRASPASRQQLQKVKDEFVKAQKQRHRRQIPGCGAWCVLSGP